MHWAAINNNARALVLLIDFNGDRTIADINSRIPLDWIPISRRPSPPLDDDASVGVLQDYFPSDM
jgi:hypothetical protein